MAAAMALMESPAIIMAVVFLLDMGLMAARNLPQVKGKSPALIAYAVPQASPSLYFGLSLGVTFPLNILFGIPVYVALAKAVLI